MNESFEVFGIVDLNNALDDISAAIENYYDVGKVADIYRCELGETNRCFIAKCVKDGKEKKYFAKLYGVYKTLEKLKYELELEEYFMNRANGDMECALPIMTKNGSYALIGSNGETNLYFTLSTFLPGETMDEGKWRFVMVDEYLDAFATGLGKFHRYSYGFVPSEDSLLQSKLDEDIVTMEKTIENVSVLADDPRTAEYYEFFEPEKERVLNLLRKNYIKYMEVKDKLPKGISHGDCSPNNYRYTSDLKACGVCDLDWSKRRPRLYDVAWMISEVLHVFNPETGLSYFEKERMVEFIRSYNRKVTKDPDFIPGKLTEDELEFLPEMLEIVFTSMLISDRIAYMLEDNERLGKSEDNIGLTFFGLAAMNYIGEHKEEIKEALLAAEY